MSRDLLELIQCALYRAYRKTIDDARRGTTEIALIPKLFNVTELPFKRKRPSRN
jgi:hypothetical protein